MRLQTIYENNVNYKLYRVQLIKLIKLRMMIVVV